jgi:hypothetical protein
MTKLSHKLKSHLALLAIFGLLLCVFACDMLGEDANPDNPDVSITNHEVFAISNRSAFIDLFARVKTNGTIRFEISSEPKNGNLSEVASGLLKYSPFQTFKSGHDSFTFAIYGLNDKLLLRDSINIIVGDSTNVPCNFYPKDDWVYSMDSPFNVDVLSNDFLCGDTSDIVLEIYKPGISFPPFYGNATVISGNRIQYEAKVKNANTIDTIIYKISKASDASIVGFGTVYIDVNPYTTQCEPVTNVFATATRPDPIIDTLFILVYDSTKFCNVHYDSLTITSQPKYGSVGSQTDNYVEYIYELTVSNQVLIDTMNYNLCNGETCIDGNIFIKIN